MRVGTVAARSHLLLSDEEYAIARSAFDRSYGELEADAGAVFWTLDARLTYVCGAVRRALEGHRAGRAAP